MRSITARAVLAVLLCAAAPAIADDGDPDPSFSGDGKAWHRWPSTYEGAEVVDATTRAVAALGDGGVAALGSIKTLGPDRFDACMIVKWRSTGAVDSDFGDDGEQLAYFGAEPEKDDCIAILPTAANTLLVVGATESMQIPYGRPGLVKLRADGSLDTSFGVGGKVVIASHPLDPNAGFLFRAATQTADGKILIVGSCTNCGHGSFEDFAAVRLNANGSVDTTFADSGWLSFGRIDEDDHYVPEAATSVAVDTQGRVVIGGYAESYDDVNHQQRPLIVRTTPNGALDTSFNGTGYLELNLLGSFATSAVTVDPATDAVVFAANITNLPDVVPGAMLIRVRPDGTLDENFGDNGFVLFQEEEGTNITALAMRSDRRVTAAGWIDPNGSDTRDFFAARVLFNGTLDATFDGNGVNRYTFDFSNDSVDLPAGIVLSGERPVIAGTLASQTSDSRAVAIVRLQSNRLFDDGFE